MKHMLILAAILLPLAAGCADVRLNKEPRDGRTAVQPTDDGRPTADIRQDNARLRARNQELERAYQQWQAAIDREEATKRQLKDQRGRLEDDLDRAKKRTGADD